MTREDPALMLAQKHRAVMREASSAVCNVFDDLQALPTRVFQSATPTERINIRKSVLDEVMKKMVGEDVLSKVCCDSS